MPSKAGAFEQKTVEQLAHGGQGAIKIGPFGSQLKKEAMRTMGVKVYGQENIILSDWAAGERRVSPSKAAALASCRLEPGDVVLTMMGTIGRCDVFPADAEPGIMDSHLLRIQPDTSVVDRHFLARVIADPRAVGRQVDRLSHGSIMAGLSSKIVRQLCLPVPPLPEQRRIAEILDTLDEAIRKTEQIIAKLQQMKQGLLHDLLTRGIDENGELRDPERHAEQFQDSPLGRIPKAWDVRPLGKVVPRAEYGISVSLHDRGAIPVLRMMNMAAGEAELTDMKFSDSPQAQGLLLRHGDVLFNRTNSIEHVGRTGIWRGQLPHASFASYLVRLVPATNLLSPEFLNRWLNWDATQISIRRWATPGVHQVNINPTSLRRTLIALPRSVDEQEAISSALMQQDDAMRAEARALAKLRTVKNGLMDDLLTGHVRVRVPEEAAT